MSTQIRSSSEDFTDRSVLNRESITLSLISGPNTQSNLFPFKIFNIQKTKIMASGPITSWEIGGETVETVSDFIFLGSKILQIVIAAMK